MKADFVEKCQLLLEKELKVTHLEIENDSASHAGHGAIGGHYNLKIASPLFEGKTTIQCHRLVNQVLIDEFQKGVIHALSIQIIR